MDKIWFSLTILHIPPKSFVCCILEYSVTNHVVCVPHLNETTQSKLTLYYVKAVSQINVYHISQMK